MNNVDPDLHQRSRWQAFYRQHFNMSVNMSEVRIPIRPKKGKWRLIMIAQGLAMNSAIKCYRNIIQAHNPDWNLWHRPDADFDSVVTQNVRTPAESYAIWVRDESEPDKEYMGKSATDADSNHIIGVTLLERLIHGMIYLLETKKHLDEKNWTLCTGSRVADGRELCVFCNPPRRIVIVCWVAIRPSGSRFGLRQVVS